MDLTRTIGPWKKSSASNAANDCVEVAPLVGGRAVRDSKNPDGPTLGVPTSEWGAFVGGVKGGAFGL